MSFHCELVSFCVPMGELGGGGDEKKRFCLIDLAQQVVDESEPEAGGRARERVGMLWSRAADHTTHRKSLPCFGTSLLPLVKAYSARHAALDWCLYLRATLNNCLSLSIHLHQDRIVQLGQRLNFSIDPTHLQAKCKL